ncbi:hypothetical protein [Actinocrispum sp. NPDC049592]|uniref:bestrophin-like domain n=1 Tax=Actinocrispum sp. NPDC049592 TaxID=3154835 RepID=UPI003433FBF3
MLVIGAMFLTAIATILAGKRRRAQEGEYNSDALGFIGGVLNALFIVVLAFYTVITWTNADSTEQHAQDEASSLTEIYWQVTDAPPESRAQIRSLVKEYTNEVINREWPAMDRGTADQKADDLLIALRSEINRLPTDSDLSVSVRDKAMDGVRTVADERRARVNEATSDDTLLTILLLGTIIGGISMVVYPLVIGLTSGIRHVASLVFLAALIAVTVWFSLELDQPFQGMIHIAPDAFTTALAEYPRIP